MSEASEGGGGVPPPTVGSFLILMLAIVRVSCIPLVYFVDLKSLHNSEKIVLLKE